MTRRVGVTTTADRVQAVCDLLAARGLVGVPLPCIRIAPAPREDIARVRAAARDADWIVVTSARAVRTVWPDGGMPQVPAAVVGSATGDAVEVAGGNVALVGSGGAAALVDLLVDRVAGARVVFPRARAADGATATSLVAAGAAVTDVVAYRTVPVPPGDDAVDAVLLGSPSALEGWRMTRGLDGLVVAVMGETTADAVRAVGREPDVVPPEPSLAAVVDALADHLEGGSR